MIGVEPVRGGTDLVGYGPHPAGVSTATSVRIAGAARRGVPVSRGTHGPSRHESAGGLLATGRSIGKPDARDPRAVIDETQARAPMRGVPHGARAVDHTLAATHDWATRRTGR